MTPTRAAPALFLNTVYSKQSAETLSSTVLFPPSLVSHSHNRTRTYYVPSLSPGWDNREAFTHARLCGRMRSTFLASRACNRRVPGGGVGPHTLLENFALQRLMQRVDEGVVVQGGYHLAWRAQSLARVDICPDEKNPMEGTENLDLTLASLPSSLDYVVRGEGGVLN